MQTIERLSARTADRLAPGIERPAFDRGATGIGIVHVGVGAFMRSHFAEYCDDAIAAGGGDWGIAGLSLRHPDARDSLRPQDCLYILGIRDGEDERRRLIGSLRSVDVAPEDPRKVVRLLADGRVRIVTLTVTEKGYCLDPDSGELAQGHPDIRHDLQHPDEPRSTIGFLAASLKKRMHSSLPPPTLLSCDNLPANGAKLEAAVLSFARELDPSLAAWIAENATFPNTMVDRIVPATTDIDIERNAAACGLRDEAYVKSEPFRQWVIEDRFCNGRPAWEEGGALFVSDVAPFEAAKLQLLNGSHSAIAYLGYLAGFRYVHDAMNDPMFARFIRGMMIHDISPVTPEPPEMRHEGYVEQLLARFGNSALEHRTWQIAMDGSQKLPQRILPCVRAQLERGGPIESFALVIAAWMRYALGRDEHGGAIDVRDPLASRFAAIAAEGLSEPGEVAAKFLAIADIFGTDLPAQPRFRGAVTEALRQLLDLGTAETIRRFAGGRT